jgi:hypothetical protein
VAIAYVSVHLKESRSTHPKNACSIILLSFSLKKISDELLFSLKFGFCFSCVQPYIAVLLLLPGSTENWIRGLIIYFLNFIRQAIVTKQKKELKRKEKKTRLRSVRERKKK